MSEDEDWGQYADEDSEESESGSDDESENQAENMFYEAEGKKSTNFKISKIEQKLTIFRPQNIQLQESNWTIHAGTWSRGKYEWEGVHCEVYHRHYQVESGQ